MNVQRTAFAGLVSYGVLWFTFWKRSRDEYLGLMGMHRFSIATGGRGCHIALGDIVLVHDEAYPRTYWRLGKRLIKGRDEQIRAASCSSCIEIRDSNTSATNSTIISA